MSTASGTPRRSTPRTSRPITKMARAMNCSIFVTNSPDVGLGEGGEGFTSFFRPSPSGGGLTRPRTFSRERQITVVGALQCADSDDTAFTMKLSAGRPESRPGRRAPGRRTGPRTGSCGRAGPWWLSPPWAPRAGLDHGRHRGRRRHGEARPHRAEVASLTLAVALGVARRLERWYRHHLAEVAQRCAAWRGRACRAATTMSAESDAVTWVVAGIGVNVRRSGQASRPARSRDIGRRPTGERRAVGRRAGGL